MTYLTWTCAGCGHVNILTVKQKDEILSKLNANYPAQAEIIKCDKCRSQAVVEARTSHDTGR